MERHPVRTALGAVAAAVALSALLTGCGEEKQLPVLSAPDGAPAPPAAKAVPAKSDPDARAVIEKAVKALTGGKPELADRGKFCRYTFKGVIHIAGAPREATQTAALAWPDRAHAANDSTSTADGSRLQVEVWLRRPDIVVASNGQEQRPGNPAEYERNFAADTLAQQWLPLLLPAADPKAVVFDLQAVSLERRDLRLVKLALGEYPVYQLYFDAKSDMLVRVEYTVAETGVSRRTAVAFGDHKPGPDGLLLPSRIECLHNKSLVEKWAVEEWKLPDAIPDAEFSPKRK